MKENTIKLVRILTILVIIGIVISLVVAKVLNPDLSTGWLVIFFFISLLIGGILFFGNSIYLWFKSLGMFKEEDPDKIPQPIKQAEAYRLVEEKMKSKHYLDYIDEVIDDGTEVHGEKGNQIIYFLEFTTKYSSGKKFVSINLHYPDLISRVKTNVGPKERISIMKKLAIQSEKDTPYIERETSSSVTGVTERVREPVRQEEPKKPETKQEKSDI